MHEDKSKQVLVKDIMTKQVISVSPDTPLLEAARIINEHNFDGIPVVDESSQLVGILTEYDLITRTSGINSSFLEKVLSDIRREHANDSEDKSISSMKVRDIMNSEPLALKESSTFDEVLQTFIAHHHVNPIPIINDKNQIVGIVSRFDILRPLNLLGYGSKNIK